MHLLSDGLFYIIFHIYWLIYNIFCIFVIINISCVIV
jgi:hypothetical protein